MTAQDVSLQRAYKLAQYHCRYGTPRGLTIDDVASAALEGLWVAQHTYDSTKNAWLMWSKWRAQDAMNALIAAFLGKQRWQAERFLSLQDLVGAPHGRPVERGDLVSSSASTPAMRLLWQDELRAAWARLTGRQREVAEMLADGYSAEETGAALGIEVGTVHAHVHGARVRQPGARLPLRNSSRTHCIRGHPFSGVNLGRRRNGRRVCRMCQRRSTSTYQSLSRSRKESS